MAAMAAIRDFHAHIYFDPEQLSEAQAVAAAAGERFGVPVGHFHTRPVGPHPRGSVQLTVLPDQFGEFAAWAALVVDGAGAGGFIARRVQEWGLFKALQSGEPVDREALAAASNWLQRKVVEEADSSAVLAALGDVGRTKRVRNLAKTHAGRLRSLGR